MKKILLLFIIVLSTGFGSLFAQAINLSGRVLDETGQGLPGAGISVKGTTVGTVTDVDGNFKLQVPAGSTTITVQAIGYATRDIRITGNTVTVRMTLTAKQLQGTVVTALAIKREKRELGYTSTTVSNQDLTAGNNVSALSALQGKVAGANITSSTGGPGGSTRVILRGEKSIGNNNNAIIVVDGVIINNYDRTLSNQLTQVDFGNSGNDIDPDDIESVTVLQGPAAAALYGSIGANGAIIITTKTGRNRAANKKMEVTYKATFTESDILKYPDFQHQFGQGNIYQGIADDRRENFSWGLPFDGKLRPWGQEINGQQLVKPYSDQPDNIKSFFNKGKTLNNYVSLAGGDEKSSYFLSINSENNTGVVPNTFYNKYNIRFNGSTQLSNKFYSSINLNYTNIYSKVEAGGQAAGSVFDNLFETPRDIPVWELKNLNNPFYGYGFIDPTGVSRYGYYGAYYRNPYWVAQNFNNYNKTDRILGDVTLGFRQDDHFNIFDRVGIDASADRSFYEAPKYSFQSFDPFWSADPQILAGGYQQNNLNALQFNNDVIATYTTDLSDDIGLSVLAGNNIRFIQDNSLNADIDPATNGLVIPGFYNFQNAQGPILVSNVLDDHRTIGLYGDFKINYRRSLYLEITGRNDWSSSLIQNYRSYFYPSFNASWIFTEGMHGKFKDNILSFGKLRGGFASVGNDAPAYVNNQPGFEQTNVATAFGSVIFPFQSQPGYQLQNFIGDSLLRPERTNEYEVGVDLGLFKDRLSLSFTYYNDLSYDQITTVPIPPSTGYISREINLGDIRNSGVEITARYTALQTQSGFKWDLFGTYTRNVSKVLSLTNGLSQITIGGFEGMGIVAAVGRPYGSFYAVDLQRDPQGHVVVDPNTGLPLSTAAPVYKGTYQPRFIASWGTDLSYKGLSLHLLFTAKVGGVFYSRNKQNMDFNGTSTESATNNRDPYIYPNSVYYNSATNTYVTNTQYKFSPYDYYTNVEQFIPATALVDASYVRLQEAAIYYTIPDRYIHRTPFGSLQVGVFGTNLLLWTAKGNEFDDPEETSAGAVSNGQGFNFTARPSLRNYGVSLKVTF